MGCCCSSNRVEWNEASRLHHYPVASAERQLLPARSSAAAVIPTGLLVDTNLDTSIPDTYRHPPAPIPYDANPQGPPNNREDLANKNHPPGQTNDSEPVLETKVSDGGENEAKEAVESVITEEFDDEIKKSNTPFVAPEECPTCLEEYDEDNPKITTKCDHHFHLSCILEWMERSETCPVCDQVMEVSIPIDN
ncbi:putative E3 ubiquitin-protein ligase RHB1A [Bidens hawaiensis]|uniref:putative E3 ubiquitin-protein ligase RHB1A n=1 Tax=Bidens hawaiensis TaxID=980011 RepID=UPI004049F2F7